MSEQMYPDVRGWRIKKQRYGLVGEECSRGHKIFPPRDVCPYCIPLNPVTLDTLVRIAEGQQEKSETVTMLVSNE